MRRYLLTPLLLALLVPALHAADTANSDKAASTRAKLKSKVNIEEEKDARLRDILDELKDAAEVHFRPDTKGGVNLNTKITWKAKDKPLEAVLNDICDKADLGWYVISNKADAYYGSIRITKGKERGYEAGKEPDKTAAATKEKPEKTGKKKTEKTAKTEPEPKEKPEGADKTEKTEKTAPAEEDPEEIERIAGRRLKLAKEVLDDGKAEKAQEILQGIVKKYPKTKAAEQAKKLLDKDNDSDK